MLFLGKVKMASPRLLDRDPLTGRERWWHEIDDKHAVIETRYPATPDFLDAAKAERNATAGERFGDLRKVATVPMHIWAREIVQPMQQGDQAFLKRWLNSADHAAFRTFSGKV